MTIEEKQQHLNNIERCIDEILIEVQGLTYDQFAKEEQVKEAVYANLQMIGQAAFELAESAGEYIDLNFDTDILAELRNARYNQMAETGHEQVWTIIHEDLEEIRASAMQSSADLEARQIDKDSNID
jgi:uncharacterized protein with HEPN domain